MWKKWCKSYIILAVIVASLSGSSVHDSYSVPITVARIPVGSERIRVSRSGSSESLIRRTLARMRATGGRCLDYSALGEDLRTVLAKSYIHVEIPALAHVAQ
jgi:hypothetical protein